LQVGETAGLVAGKGDADFLHHLHRQGIELAGFDPGRIDLRALQRQLRSSAAAMGERTAFMVQTRSDVGRTEAGWGIISLSDA
jgi:hypothetical protein